MAKTRDFQDILTDLDDGRVHEQLGELWRKVVQAVKETNKPAELTLKLTAKLERGTMVVVVPKVSSKLPAPATSPTLFYTDDEGNVHRNDPKQQTLKIVTPIKPQA